MVGLMYWTVSPVLKVNVPGFKTKSLPLTAVPPMTA